MQSYIVLYVICIGVLTYDLNILRFLSKVTRACFVLGPNVYNAFHI